MKFYFKQGIRFGVLALFCLGSLHALDLTPHFEEIDGDGIEPLRKLVFLDGKKKVYLDLSKTWMVEGGGEKVTFQPGKDSSSLVTFKLSRGASQEFDEKSIAACHERIRAFLKEGAKDFIILDETKAPYAIKAWNSYQVVGRYNFYGTWIKIGLIFINLDVNQQLTVLLTGPENEFDRVATSTKTLLMSWLEPAQPF